MNRYKQISISLYWGWLSRLLWLVVSRITRTWIRNRVFTVPPASVPSTMQTLLAATRKTPFTLGKRTFASSARSWQAVPQQKPALMKEFKIYRWVRAIPLRTCCFFLFAQNMYRIQMNLTKSQHYNPTSLISIRRVLWSAEPESFFSFPFAID